MLNPRCSVEDRAENTASVAQAVNFWAKRGGFELRDVSLKVVGCRRKHSEDWLAQQRGSAGSVLGQFLGLPDEAAPARGAAYFYDSKFLTDHSVLVREKLLKLLAEYLAHIVNPVLLLKEITASSLGFTPHYPAESS